MVAEEAAILSHRLDTLLAEAERLETQLVVQSNTSAAQTVAYFALELRIARRSLAALLPALPMPPFRPVLLAGREHDLTAPRAGPA